MVPQFRDWYGADYAIVDAEGEKRPATYAEARPRVEGDYSDALRDRLLAEQAQALRKTRAVWVDDKVLAGL